MTKSRQLGLTLVAAALVALYGCGKEEPKKAEAPKAAAPVEETVTVRIGHAGPLTGGIAHLGKDNENGVRLALDEANTKKIKIGGKVVKFELMAEDDQADPKLGPTIAQKFADAKVAGVVGHLNSGVTIPASAVYNQAGIPMISGSATNPKLTEQGFKVVFRTVGRDDQQGPAVAAYIANELKSKKVAIADDATAYGEGLANEVEKTLKAAGVTIVAREKTNDKATDFKAILTKIKGKNPDAVFYGGMDATGGPMIKQARELGMKATFAFGDGACTDEMNKLAGPAAEGLVCSQAGIPTQMASKAFLDGFKAKYGDVKQYAPFTYDGANLLIAAMQKADSADPAKYLPALASISYDGATGKIEFDAKGDRKDAEMTIFQLKNGNIEPIAIIKAGKTTKVGGEAAAAAAPAEPAKDAPKK
jgi:branched-chain amino acid transport system substrate-binding protein